MRAEGRPTTPALVDALEEAFPHSRPDTRRALAATYVRRYAVGGAILRQGDDASFALVVDGLVAHNRTTADGRQLIMSIISRGKVAGIPAVSGRAVGADLIALTPSQAALWRADQVRRLATEDAGFAVDLLDHVVAKVEETVARVDSMARQDSRRRVARVISIYADLFFGERPVLTRSHLPFLVGTSREMTSRVVRRLEQERIVARVGRDRLRLLDPAGLSAVADLHPEPPRRRRTMG
jgi:CRP/FNR family transcriptional regulator